MTQHKLESGVKEIDEYIQTTSSELYEYEDKMKTLCEEEKTLQIAKNELLRREQELLASNASLRAALESGIQLTPDIITRALDCLFAAPAAARNDPPAVSEARNPSDVAGTSGGPVPPPEGTIHKHFRVPLTSRMMYIVQAHPLLNGPHWEKKDVERIAFIRGKRRTQINITKYEIEAMLYHMLYERYRLDRQQRTGTLRDDMTRFFFSDPRRNDRLLHEFGINLDGMWQAFVDSESSAEDIHVIR